MQVVLFLAVAAAIFAFGRFLTGKLDAFLEANCHARESQPSSGRNTLLIGVDNSTAAEGITDVLEQYSKSYPDVSVRIFYGAEEELLKGFSSDRFDIIFLPENAEFPGQRDIILRR